MYFLLAINQSSVRKWQIQTQWPEVSEYDGGWSTSHSQSIFFLGGVIRSRINAIKLCSLSPWTIHVSITSTSFHHIPKKANSCMQKLQLGHTLLSPFIVKQPYNKVCNAATQSSIVYIITNRPTVISLNAWILWNLLWFLLHIISCLCVFKGGGTQKLYGVHMLIIFTLDPWISQNDPLILAQSIKLSDPQFSML